MIYKSIHQENVIILNVYVPNSRVSKCDTKMIGLKREIYKYTIIVGKWNIPFSKTDKATRQKIHKEVKELNATTHQDLTGIYRTLH